MAKFNVLLVQNNAILGNKQANFNNIEKIIEPYKEQKIDLMVLSELFAIGWKCSLFPKQAEGENDFTTTNFLKKLALDYNCCVIGGSYIRKEVDDKLYNTCKVFDKHAKLICQYDKMHLFQHYGDGEADYNTIGKKPVMFELNGVKIGVSICYDIRFPELFRTYSLNGAKILVNMAAWPKSRPHHWDVLQRARAIENQAFVIAVSQCGKIEKENYNYGHSQIISPFGDVVSCMGEEEGTILQMIDTDEVDELRKNVPTLKDKNSNGYNL